MLEQLFDDLKVAEANMKQAQERQSHYTNQRRRDVQYKMGDKVLLSTSDLRLKMKVTPKLTARYIGPFTIVKVLSKLNYELDLPSSMSIHRVFHVSKLRSYNESEQFNVDRTPDIIRPPPELVDDQNEYEVEAIRKVQKKKWTDGRMYNQYLVKWKGYPEYENTWEWEETLATNAKKLLDDYNQQH